MRALLLCAAGALTFGLAACQQPEEPTPPPADMSGATEAESAAGPASTGSASGGGASAPASSATSGAGATGGSADTTATPLPGEGMMSGPSPAVRDDAKTKAEETNLHPRTP